MREFQDFGWNAMSVGFIGTVLLTFFQAWGYLSQGRRIWRERSGLSVSVLTYGYSALVFVMAFIYGLSSGSAALVFNGGLLAAMHLPILAGLYRFRGFSRGESWFLGTMAAGEAAVMFTPAAAIAAAFLAVSVGNVLACSRLPLEVWRNRDAGAVDVRVPAVAMASTAFWTGFGLVIGDAILYLVCPVLFVLSALTIGLCHRFRQPG